MVLVTRSGMEASRLLPSASSFINPLTILLCEKSESQYDLTDDHPTCFIRWSSCSNMVGVNTCGTSTSRSPGRSRNSSTRTMSSSYRGSSLYVIQYSNGLLLMAAMFQVAIWSCRGLSIMELPVRKLRAPPVVHTLSHKTKSERFACVKSIIILVNNTMYYYYHPQQQTIYRQSYGPLR